MFVQLIDSASRRIKELIIDQIGAAASSSKDTRFSWPRDGSQFKPPVTTNSSLVVRVQAIPEIYAFYSYLFFVDNKVDSCNRKQLLAKLAQLVLNK